ncbi:MAG: hypothetical protein EO766_17285 [Hydrotalea sp. AMD]|nr:MAG: hypothetical protein EO766_17285 [Hydrotalea sp. AMD]
MSTKTNQSRTYGLYSVSYHYDTVNYVAYIRSCDTCVNSVPQLLSVLQHITTHETNKCPSFDSSWIFISNPTLDWAINDAFPNQRDFAIKHKNNLIAVFGIDADESDTYVLIQETVPVPT